MSTPEEVQPPGPVEGGEKSGNGSDVGLAEWTIMIYMASDDGLTTDCVRALTEIKSLTVSDPDRVHVIAQIDPEDPRMPTRRLVINKNLKKHKPQVGTQTVTTGSAHTPAFAGGKSGHLDEDKVDIGPGDVRFPGSATAGRGGATGSSGQAHTSSESAEGEVNTADPETLFDFISRSVQDYPAQHYMLILDGHSAGVEEGFLMKDSNPPGSMSFADLKRVLEAVRDPLGIHLEVLGLDSCLMNMAEVCFEFRGLADIIVGSQGLVPGRGWPFSKIIGSLNDAGGKLDAESLSSLVVREFMDFYLEDSVLGGMSVDLGALRVAGSEAVAGGVKALASLMTEGLQLRVREIQDGIVLAHWRSQSYNGELYVDLWDFCGQLAEHCDSYKSKDAAASDLLVKIPEQCRVVQKAVEAMVVSSCFLGVEYQHSHGLSIYFPWSEIFAYYRELDFAASGWGQFLAQYLDATRRETRNKSGFMFRSVIRKDPPWGRRDPPWGGPAEAAHSMRNPSIEYPNGITCVRDPKKLADLLDTFSIQ